MTDNKGIFTVLFMKENIDKKVYFDVTGEPRDPYIDIDIQGKLRRVDI